jgi:enterochelin esterase-like enzyme
MPGQSWETLRGRLVQIAVGGECLRENRLGEPAVRQVAVYVPAEVDRPVPLLVALQGFLGSGLMFPGWKTFDETLPQRLDRLIASGAMPPVVLAMPDCFTRLGGNQYVDNPVLGRWSAFLTDELVPALEASFPVLPGKAHRGVFGKSSGGYGAMWQAMTRGDCWGAIACHSGDVDFDLVYRPHLVPALDRLAKALRRPPRTQGDLDAATSAFLAELYASKKADGKDLLHLMTLAMAASYDPRPDAPDGIRLPLDPWTATLDAAAWARWRQWDPLVRVEHPETLASLRSLRGIFVDCGSRDQYALVYGSRALSAAFGRHGIAHTYEEFDDDHSSIAYRQDVSLPWLARTLAAETDQS